MQEKGLSQYALAERSGVPQPTIQRILSKETVSPKLSTVEKLAKAIGISPADLMGSASGSLIKFEQKVVGVREADHITSIYDIFNAIDNVVEISPESNKLIKKVITAARDHKFQKQDWMLLDSLIERLTHNKDAQ